jgi:hypothetical protein
MCCFLMLSRCVTQHAVFLWLPTINTPPCTESLLFFRYATCHLVVANIDGSELCAMPAPTMYMSGRDPDLSCPVLVLRCWHEEMRRRSRDSRARGRAWDIDPPLPGDWPGPVPARAGGALRQGHGSAGSTPPVCRYVCVTTGTQCHTGAPVG